MAIRGNMWLASFALAEFCNLWLLARLARGEGIRLVDLYPRRAGRAADLEWTGLAVVVAAPLALLPTALLAQALWSDPAIGQDMLFHPVWVPAAWVMLIVFPVIHALTELPTYYGYVLPRLEAITSRVAMPLVLTASTLGVNVQPAPSRNPETALSTKESRLRRITRKEVDQAERDQAPEANSCR